jgi:hypothetical protein
LLLRQDRRCGLSPLDFVPTPYEHHFIAKVRDQFIIVGHYARAVVRNWKYVDEVLPAAVCPGGGAIDRHSGRPLKLSVMGTFACHDDLAIGANGAGESGMDTRLRRWPTKKRSGPSRCALRDR